MKNNIILVDYENLFNSATNNHQLKLTDKGFEEIIKHYCEKYNVKDEMVFVSCHFEGYQGLLGLVEELSYTPIRTLELDKDMSDGYLIAYGTKALVERKDEIDKVVLIAGDKIYTGLVRLATSLVSETIIVSWKDSFSKYLKQINRKKVTLENIEEVFVLEDKEKEGWFNSYAISKAEKELIQFLLTAENSSGYQLIPLANVILKWEGSPIFEENDGDYHKIKRYIEERCTNGGFLKKFRLPSPKKNQEVWHVKLNRNHDKVKSITK